MTLKNFLRAGSMGALAAALSFGALPASAQESDGEPGYQRNAGDRAAQRAARVEARQEQREQRAAQAPQAAQRQERVREVPVARAAPQQQGAGRDWNRAERRSDTGAERAGRDWNRRDNTSNDWGQTRAAQAQARAEAQATARTRSQRWDGRRQGGISGTSNTGVYSGSADRNRTYGDRDRNTTYRDGYRDGRRSDARQDSQQTQSAYRSGYRDGVRTDNWRDGQRSGYRDGHRSWSRDWRRDNRYNWYGYRSNNRDIYRLGRYYAPYDNYRYSRVSIGFRLGSPFFGSRYWINDPWQYRLPAAYGPYRWVRYYDDALLVDIYSGEVVDVIHGFFW